MRLLLEKGADIDAKTVGRKTALSLAAQTGHKAVVQLLLEKSADVKAVTVEKIRRYLKRWTSLGRACLG